MEILNKIFLVLFITFNAYMLIFIGYEDYLRRKNSLDNLVSQDKIYIDLSMNDLSYLFNLMRYEHTSNKSEYFRKALREEIEKELER